MKVGSKKAASFFPFTLTAQIGRKRQRRFWSSLALRMCRPPEKPVPIGRRRTNLCRAPVRPGTICPYPKPRSFERGFPRFKLFVTTFAFMLTWAFCYGDGPQSPGARFHIVWLTALTLHLIAFRYRSIRFVRSLWPGSPHPISNGWPGHPDFAYSGSERP